MPLAIASISATKPDQLRRKGGHQPRRPQYQPVMRGSFSGVYHVIRPLKRSASRAAYSATNLG